MSKFFYFDIETAARPDALDYIGEIVANRTLKDPAKIAADIEAKKAAAIEQAALSPMTGRIIAFSYAWDDDWPQVVEADCEDGEGVILDEIELCFNRAITQGYRLVGYNITRFDIPFIIRRMIANYMPVKTPIIKLYHGKPMLDEAFIDVLNVWKLGSDDNGNSLSNVSKLLGFGEKTGNGKDFAALIKTDREAAIEYCRQDIIKTRQVWNAIKGSVWL